MQISQQILTTHQFTDAEWTALREAENLVCQIYDSYDENIVLTSAMNSQEFWIFCLSWLKTEW